LQKSSNSNAEVLHKIKNKFSKPASITVHYQSQVDLQAFVPRCALQPFKREHLPWTSRVGCRLKGPRGTPHAASGHHGPRFKLTAGGLQHNPGQVT